MEIGDIVTSYWKGYYRLVEKDYEYYKSHEGYNENEFLASVIQTHNSNGDVVNSKKVKKCSSAWCKPAKNVIDIEVQKLKNIINKLETFKQSIE